MLLETMKDIGAFVGALLSCITFMTILIKPIRQMVVNFILKNSRTQEVAVRMDQIEREVSELKQSFDRFIEQDTMFQNAITTSNAAIIGNTIKNIYNAYKATKKIPEHEYKMMDKLYETYHDVLGGNGVIEHIYLEMTCEGTEWEIMIE